ncbi:hypothetical protein N0V90_013366 [Kalmusia sp. IMI 367209]|nr:hypothetical protein N0V90_013366 [Kalmusia sp. IMI 367209]
MVILIADETSPLPGFVSTHKVHVESSTTKGDREDYTPNVPGQLEDGDRSEQIFQQAKALKGKLDFVTFTSGGNDLCLAGIFKDCIMVPYFKNSACETVIAKAQENVKSIITANIKQILGALNDKVNKDGLVVVNGYAQFFDTSSNNCEKQSCDFLWLLPLGASYQALTISRRKTFNQLVLEINKAIRDAVDEAAKDDDIKYMVGYSEWDH